MNFLEAHGTLKAFAGGPPLPLLLGMSGTGEPLELYVRAAAAELGYDARVSFLPFGTLRQSMLESPVANTREVLLLFPWDLAPELDWRTGIASTAPDYGAFRQQFEEEAARVSGRGAGLVYVDAAVPPLWLDPALNESCRTMLRGVMESLHASILPTSTFALGSYLASGQPIAPKELGVVARAIMKAALAPKWGTAKVLVTDLDHTLWHGIVGDDGLDGIHFRPEGKGFRHFLYQTLLKRLRADGVLLAAVTKNDDEVARQPFAVGEMVLRDEDFVGFIASWQPKSAQIQMLAEQLNLGLDAFVFVDDNPVEIAEVTAGLPAVACVPFPAGEQGLGELFDVLVRLFQRTVVTAEDRERTLLYRRRMATLPPREGTAADIRGFLRGLDMKLVIEDRTAGDRSRAVQLINKTNQFNINGLKLEDEEVERQLASGSRLFTASLSDRSGDHGQILAALVAPDGTLTSMVMSCRVFQRRVEHAFLAWLSVSDLPPKAAVFRATERNGPARIFLGACVGDVVEDGTVVFALDQLSAFTEDLALFTVNAQVS